MRRLIFIFFSFLPLWAVSQEDSSRIETNAAFENRKADLDKYLNHKELPELKFDTNIPDYRPIVKQPEAIILDLPQSPIYVGPQFDERTHFLHYPYYRDYNYTALYGLGSKTYLVTNSHHNTYPTLGQISKIGGQFGYQPTGWLNLSGGPFVSKTELYNTFNTNIGINGKAQFVLNDRFRVNGYGQYSTDKTKNPMSSMYNPTYYGGTLEVRITDTFGVEGGVMRELNPFNGKWVNKPYFSPVFYSPKPKKKQDPNREY